MKYSIALKNLPFKPEKDQVIYVENHHDEWINAFIRKNYDLFKWYFLRSGLEFVYLPMFFKDEDIREKVLYYAPYLTEETLEQTELNNNFLLKFMSHQENREKILPSLIYAPKEMNGEWIFKGQFITIDKKEDREAIIQWLYLASDIEEELASDSKPQEAGYDEDYDDDTILFRMGDDSDNEPSKTEYSSSGNFWEKWNINIKKSPQDTETEENKDYTTEPNLDEIQEEDVEEVLKALDKSIERLLLIGVPLGAIHELIDKRETISRLYITDDLRITLPDYNNKEVRMTALYKAVYLLFLFHSEGIVLKHMEEYHKELVYFYKKTSKVEELTPKMLESINKLECIGNNYLNTIFAKIRAAFLQSFDKHLARHYIIQGSPGEPYRIPLDPDLVKFEEDEV